MSKSLVDMAMSAIAVAMLTSTAIRARDAQSVAPSRVDIKEKRNKLEPTTFLAHVDPPMDTLLTSRIVKNDMFRLANAPTAVRYALAVEGAGASLPAVPRPRLAVKAIIGGPPWQAMIEGFPGQSVAIVRAGQLVGAFTVRTVGRDSVVILGADTSWTLSLHGARQ